MLKQEASRVVSAPLPAVLERLKEIERWPEFLSHVTAVTQTSHARYTFHVVEGASERDAACAVSVDVHRHAIRWKSLHGPTVAGSLTLSEADPGHTLVRLELTQHPATVGAFAAEMLTRGSSAALIDLEALDRYLTGSAV